MRTGKYSFTKKALLNRDPAGRQMLGDSTLARWACIAGTIKFGGMTQ